MADHCSEYRKMERQGEAGNVQGQALKILCAIDEGKEVEDIRRIVDDSCGQMTAWVSVRLRGERGRYGDPFSRPPAPGRTPEESDVEERRREDIEAEARSIAEEYSPVRELPRYGIRGKTYFRDDRLGEYRNVLNPHDRITFDEFERGGMELETPSRR